MRNVQVNDTIKISQLTERQRKIYEAIKTRAINVPNNVQVNVQLNIPNLAALLMYHRRPSDVTYTYYVT